MPYNTLKKLPEKCTVLLHIEASGIYKMSIVPWNIKWGGKMSLT